MEKIKMCIEELKEVEIEEDGAWKPKHRENYWYIDSFGEVHVDRWLCFGGDEFRYSVGNVFKTKEEAEFKAERLEVLAELKQFSKDFKFGAYNYYLSLIMSSKCFYHNISYDIETDRKAQSVIYFESEKMAREAVKTVGEDRIKKYLFEVEE